jgi:Rps23 Pro-64 3,4-dihydroxylase Tpa1-like proline 4-hydroxylase
MQNNIFNYDFYLSKVDELQKQYSRAEVFPHISFDNFVNEGVLKTALEKFPKITEDGWIHYQHFNENKGGLNKKNLIPNEILNIIEELNSEKFVSFLSELTGIKGLIADETMEGGGIHQIEQGGFLNIHADFTAHPHKEFWKRRVNVLLYLNENWQEEWGGHLELWTKDMKNCFEKILPIFNRCVIFNTDFDSYHGHPNPLKCPDGVTRKSIALYYFTEEKVKPKRIATNYQATPSDKLVKKLFIWLDKQILSIYNIVKARLGISDAFVSKILNIVRKFR